MTVPLPSYDLVEHRPLPSQDESASTRRSNRGNQLLMILTIWLCISHGVGIWMGMGGLEGIRGPWPLLLNDHGVHYHHGLVAGHFLRSNWTMAGYDPSFMSGYASSIVSDLSSTLSDLAMMASGDRPILGYKLHVLGCSAVTPWLIGLATIAWKGKPLAVLLAVGFYVIYFWTDFPAKYAELGMLNYLLAVPLGLIAAAALARYCERGGIRRWFWAWLASSSVFLVHLTSPMFVGPAVILAYGVAVIRARGEGRPYPVSRHLGLWLMFPPILAVNGFWLLPGFLLRSTLGKSEFAFSHPEGVFVRLGQFVWTQPPVQVVLLGLMLVGLVVLNRREPVAAAALGGFMAAGFGWGYLAAALRSLDFLQPGRHTYACYSAACVGAGIGLAEVLSRLRAVRSGRLDIWVGLALILVGIRIFGPALEDSFRSNALPEYAVRTNKSTISYGFLASKPTPS